ncbi:MAG: glycosyltransferase family 1 protein [Chitinophagaceae bacterium]|nr:MAG: glycosyltransferase family 1 protein [Chitinophagaceae bacterium]
MPDYKEKTRLQKHIKLIRITTVPIALAYPLRGQPSYMHSHGFQVLMVSSQGKELELVVKQETCPHEVVPMTRSITPFRDLRSLFLLIALFIKHKPEIVHTETPKAGLLGMWAAWFCRVPVRIHTVAGLPLMVEQGFKLRLLKFVEKLTYAAATRVWPNSESLKRFILENKFCSPAKLTIVGKGSSNGVDTERFTRSNLHDGILSEIKQSIHYDPSFRYLLFVGRMVLDKGIVELVNVFISLQQKDPTLKLILAGQFERSLDPLPAETEHAILHHPGIIHIPWTNKVEYYMALSDFFVFPSYREGFPNVLLEAAVMKLPIICSRIAGNIDIVTHNETGLIFESRDQLSLHGALDWALNNPLAIQQMTERLYDFIFHTFPRELFWKNMKEEYDKLLPGAKAL